MCTCPSLSPQNAGVQTGVLQIGRPKPDGVFLFAHAYPIKGDGLLEVAMSQPRTSVPHQTKSNALCLGVVGSDITVKQSTLYPHRLSV